MTFSEMHWTRCGRRLRSPPRCLLPRGTRACLCTRHCIWWPAVCGALYGCALPVSASRWCSSTTQLHWARARHDRLIHHRAPSPRPNHEEALERRPSGGGRWSVERCGWCDAARADSRSHLRPLRRDRAALQQAVVRELVGDRGHRRVSARMACSFLIPEPRRRRPPLPCTLRHALASARSRHGSRAGARCLSMLSSGMRTALVCLPSTHTTRVWSREALSRH